MASKKGLSADEIAAILEEQVGLLEAEIYITPPDNPLLSDEDSGDEEETNFNHLSGNQLKAVSEARITKVVSGEIVTEEVQFFEELTSLEGFPGPNSSDPAPKSSNLEPVPEASTSQEKKKKKPIRKWVRTDIKEVQSKTWTLPQFMGEDMSPVQIFELFFDDVVVKMLVDFTNIYARQAGDMTFELTLDEMRIFLAILLLTGYNPLPRYKMYWEMSDDCHNEAVSKAISRGRFEKITKYLHMCDNTNLSASDKFAKNEKYDFFFDNFFTSLSLLDELKERGCTGTGTVRSNRVENAPLKESTVLKKMPRGSFDQLTDTNSGTTLIRYHDNSIVTIASNRNGVHPTGKSKRYSRSDNRYIEVVAPSAIISYNSFMGGVDRLDENISKLRIHFRMKKWYYQLFAFPINVSINNAWLIYRQMPRYKERPLDLLGFTRQVTNCYFQKYSARMIIGRPLRNPKSIDKRVLDDVRYDRIEHLISPLGKQGRCGQCKKNTTKKCCKCNIPLHANCFTKFHLKYHVLATNTIFFVTCVNREKGVPRQFDLLPLTPIKVFPGDVIMACDVVTLEKSVQSLALCTPSSTTIVKIMSSFSRSPPPIEYPNLPIPAGGGIVHLHPLSTAV
uniref:PiggyBac transposable element-derived protein domain-containing protein n=1 Tax=Timema genevievae TaxID=629358 RepID=A0A7R9PMT4_TIMGE|nr:unnamed protein product [Timema genevievae]